MVTVHDLYVSSSSSRLLSLLLLSLLLLSLLLSLLLRLLLSLPPPGKMCPAGYAHRFAAGFVSIFREKSDGGLSFKWRAALSVRCRVRVASPFGLSRSGRNVDRNFRAPSC